MSLSSNECNGFYARMSRLEMKLKESEAERLDLEEKFNSLLRSSKAQENMRIHQLRDNYRQLLEQDKIRCDRNDTILRTLNRVESRASALTAKTDRLRVLKHHFETRKYHNSQDENRRNVKKPNLSGSLCDINKQSSALLRSHSLRSMSASPLLNFPRSPIVSRKSSLVVPDSEILGIHLSKYKFSGELNSLNLSFRRKLFDDSLKSKPNTYYDVVTNNNDNRETKLETIPLSDIVNGNYEFSTTHLNQNVGNRLAPFVDQYSTPSQKEKYSTAGLSYKGYDHPSQSESRLSISSPPGQTSLTSYSTTRDISTKPLIKSHSFSGLLKKPVTYSTPERHSSFLRRPSYISHRSVSPQTSSKYVSVFASLSPNLTHNRVKSPLGVVDDIFKKYLINYDKRYLSDPISESKYGKYLYPSRNHDIEPISNHLILKNQNSFEPKDEYSLYDSESSDRFNRYGSSDYLKLTGPRHPYSGSVENLSSSPQNNSDWKEWDHFLDRYQYLPRNDVGNVHNENKNYDDSYITNCKESRNNEPTDRFFGDSNIKYPDTTHATDHKTSSNQNNQQKEIKSLESPLPKHTYRSDLYDSDVKYPELDSKIRDKSIKINQTPKRVSFSNEYLYDDRSDTEVSLSAEEGRGLTPPSSYKDGGTVQNEPLNHTSFQMNMNIGNKYDNNISINGENKTNSEDFKTTARRRASLFPNEEVNDSLKPSLTQSFIKSSDIEENQGKGNSVNLKAIDSIEKLSRPTGSNKVEDSNYVNTMYNRHENLKANGTDKDIIKDISINSAKDKNVLGAYDEVKNSFKSEQEERIPIENPKTPVKKRITYKDQANEKNSENIETNVNENKLEQSYEVKLHDGKNSGEIVIDNEPNLEQYQDTVYSAPNQSDVVITQKSPKDYQTVPGDLHTHSYPKEVIQEAIPAMKVQYSSIHYKQSQPEFSEYDHQKIKDLSDKNYIDPNNSMYLRGDVYHGEQQQSANFIDEFEKDNLKEYQQPLLNKLPEREYLQQGQFREGYVPNIRDQYSPNAYQKEPFEKDYSVDNYDKRYSLEYNQQPVQYDEGYQPSQDLPLVREQYEADYSSFSKDPQYQFNQQEKIYKQMNIPQQYEQYDQQYKNQPVQEVSEHYNKKFQGQPNQYEIRVTDVHDQQYKELYDQQQTQEQYDTQYPDKKAINTVYLRQYDQYNSGNPNQYDTQYPEQYQQQLPEELEKLYQNQYEQQYQGYEEQAQNKYNKPNQSQSDRSRERSLNDNEQQSQGYQQQAQNQYNKQYQTQSNIPRQQSSEQYEQHYSEQTNQYEPPISERYEQQLHGYQQLTQDQYDKRYQAQSNMPRQQSSVQYDQHYSEQTNQYELPITEQYEQQLQGYQQQTENQNDKQYQAQSNMPKQKISEQYDQHYSEKTNQYEPPIPEQYEQQLQGYQQQTENQNDKQYQAQSNIPRQKSSEQYDQHYSEQTNQYDPPILEQYEQQLQGYQQQTQNQYDKQYQAQSNMPRQKSSEQYDQHYSEKTNQYEPPIPEQYEQKLQGYQQQTENQNDKQYQAQSNITRQKSSEQYDQHYSEQTNQYEPPILEQYEQQLQGYQQQTENQNDKQYQAQLKMPRQQSAEQFEQHYSEQTNQYDPAISEQYEQLRGYQLQKQNQYDKKYLTQSNIPRQKSSKQYKEHSSEQINKCEPPIPENYEQQLQGYQQQTQNQYDKRYQAQSNMPRQKSSEQYEQRNSEQSNQYDPSIPEQYEQQLKKNQYDKRYQAQSNMPRQKSTEQYEQQYNVQTNQYESHIPEQYKQFQGHKQQTLIQHDKQYQGQSNMPRQQSSEQYEQHYSEQTNQYEPTLSEHYKQQYQNQPDQYSYDYDRQKRYQQPYTEEQKIIYDQSYHGDFLAQDKSETVAENIIRSNDPSVSIRNKYDDTPSDQTQQIPSTVEPKTSSTVPTKDVPDISRVLESDSESLHTRGPVSQDDSSEFDFSVANK